MLGKFIVEDFIAIAAEMRRFPVSNENTNPLYLFRVIVLSCKLKNKRNWYNKAPVSVNAGKKIIKKREISVRAID
jgi:hypothetical protein